MNYIPPRPQKLSFLKVILLQIDDFSDIYGFLALYLRKFAKRFIKKLSLKMVKCSLSVENPQIIVPGIHKIAICEKLSSLIHFHNYVFQKQSFLALSIKIFKQVFLKMKFLNILKYEYSLLQANKLMIALKKWR